MFNIKSHPKTLFNILITFIIITLVLSVFMLYTFSDKEKNNFIAPLFISVLVIISIIKIILINKIRNTFNRIEEKRELYSKILESIPNGIFVHKKLKFIYGNNFGAKLIGAENAEQIIGRPIEDFIELDYEKIGEERINRALNEQEFKPKIDRLSLKLEGEKVEVEIHTKPLLLNGKVAVLNIVKDISDQRKINYLQKKVKESEGKLRKSLEYDNQRNEFIANISHELRTPLTLIFGIIQMLQRDLRNSVKKNSNAVKHLAILKQNSYRLLRLVNNIIDLSKIDAGYFKIKLQNYNIVSVVENIVLSVAEHVEEKGISLQFDTDIEEKVIACDPDKIERIMLNLLSNSVKFTDPGDSIDVSISDKGENVEIRVKDTGTGIPKEKLDYIFDRFKQIDKTLIRNYGGSGIGLSLVKSFIDMHKGNISVNSEYGKGTEFVIILPSTTVKGEENKCIQSRVNSEKYVERIEVEFSDIYS
ncbi:sensor histidine kinase [Caldisalinibacter kiritimatiensis]|uniref:histidine kinase n=1 Tax=Caldisalinibacter kiritimatiensis TaxID=1304284 RepID=R1AV77_9FIRM|nr:HAMP domain-containing sensor histidine kinase [Caldisalinibacter kiritimatiensis]EOD00542.1 Sensory transduction histidine kinase [Caldisalinibacter kiritimatiensis]